MASTGIFSGSKAGFAPVVLLAALALADLSPWGRGGPPPVHVKALPGAGDTLTRIGFGSCLRQNLPQPIWRSVREIRPDVFIMMGDNVYGDTHSGTTYELRRAYSRLSRSTDFRAARAEIPFLAIWDDHDYGVNDGGARYPLRRESEALFRRFWQVEQSAPRTGGLYQSYMFGPDGQRVQVILLDTRSFRSPLTRKPSGSRVRGNYIPDPDPNKTMLGAAQWRWLKEQLARPADLRIVVSSVQVLAEGHGFERWGNLPKQRQRLLTLLERAGGPNLVLLSGDRHNAAIYEMKTKTGRLLEITSSSLNMPFPNKDKPGPYRLGNSFDRANFGLLTVFWDKGYAEISVLGEFGRPGLGPVQLQLQGSTLAGSKKSR